MITYFQDSHILHYQGRFYNAKSSSFFDRFTANLKKGEKLNIYMRRKEITDPSMIPSLMEVSTEKIEFHEMPSFWNITKWLRIYNMIKDIIGNTEFAYLRAEGIYGAIAGYFCIKRGVKYMVVMPADPEVGLKEHGVIGHIIAFFHTRLVKNVVKKADYAYYVTQSYLQNKYPSDGVVLGCSDVQLDPIEDEVLENRIKKINNKDKKLIIGTAGALLPMIKGQDLVLRAIKNLCATIDVEYHLIGIGDATEIETLAKEIGIEDKLFIEGTIPHEDVFKWLDNIDVYIQPSRTEGLPRAIIEAMSRALPCIGSNVGGIPELIEKEWLFKHDKNTIRAIEDLLIKINDKSTCIRLATRNFECSKVYDRRIVVQKNTEFFKSFDAYARTRQMQ